MCLLAIFKIFLGEASVHVLSPFVTEFLIIKLKGFKFWLQVLCWICDLKIFSSVVCLFYSFNRDLAKFLINIVFFFFMDGAFVFIANT